MCLQPRTACAPCCVRPFLIGAQFSLPHLVCTHAVLTGTPFRRDCARGCRSGMRACWRLCHLCVAGLPWRRLCLDRDCTGSPVGPLLPKSGGTGLDRNLVGGERFPTDVATSAEPLDAHRQRMWVILSRPLAITGVLCSCVCVSISVTCACVCVCVCCLVCLRACSPAWARPRECVRVCLCVQICACL